MHPHGMPRFARMQAVAILVVVLVLGWVLVVHARGYFFLGDDFTLVGSTTRLPLRELLLRPAIGFYRPLGFLLLWLERGAFGWGHPAGYSAVSALLHVANAILLWRLVARLGMGEAVAGAAAALFSVSSWAGEAVLWVSSQFDLLATLLVLAALHGFLSFETKRRTALLWAGLLGFGACLAKEHAVVLPGVWLAFRAAAPGVREHRREIAIATAVAALAVLLALAARAQVMDPFSGAYGNLISMLSSVELGWFALAYLTALGKVPLDPAGPAFVETELAHAGAAVLLFLLAFPAPRRTLALAAGFLLCTVPVLWSLPGGIQMQGARLSYLPGLFAATLLAQAFAWDRRALRLVASGALALSCVTALISLAWQVRVYRAAGQTARAVLTRFEPLLATSAPVFIPDLPREVEDGPQILRDYAFSEFFAGRAPPRVRTNPVVFRYAEGTLVPFRHFYPRPVAAEPNELVWRATSP
jgi:hypothetical protein